MKKFLVGQRVFSESEPELGLGTVLSIEFGNLEVYFAATETTRRYVAEGAPLKRINFRIGQSVELQSGENFKIESIKEEHSQFRFVDVQGQQISEADLSDKLSLSGPQDRLMAGSVDKPHLFDLRLTTHKHNHREVSSELYGFNGPRIDLIPHQFYVADEVCSMPSPRVLLADEVGLGKTVEAGLILHKLLLGGSVKRVLIILPDALVNQWFVEMYRKFNLWFSIIDKERFDAVRENPDADNPFLTDPLVLCSSSFAVSSNMISESLKQAEWDLLIVDEAHHLEWHDGVGSPEYNLVEALSKLIDRMILLTATPDQLGEDAHFARLRLLDSDRFYDFESFKEEQFTYRKNAVSIDEFVNATSLTKKQITKLGKLLGAEHPLLHSVEVGCLSEDLRHRLLRELIDRLGTSRIIFRNTRKVMKNFPVRIPLPVELEDQVAPINLTDANEILEAYDADLFIAPGQNKKVRWVCEKLTKHKDEKFLLICSTRAKAEAIEKGIREHMEMKMSIFHEGLTMNQRDRNAVFFASPSGSRLLICSEIGSEGRNFQFCHNLILFDLPLNPGLLEQRIGRLDRIGQSTDIQIHFPYRKNTAEQVMADFYAQGLGAFSAPLHGAEKMALELGGSLRETVVQFAEQMKGADKALVSLIEMANDTRAKIREHLEAGRDHLLEIHSFDRSKGGAICDQLAKSENQLDDYLEEVFDFLGVDSRDVEDDVYRIEPGPNLIAELPGLNVDGSLISTIRRKTLTREDVALLTWEHPLVRSAIDMILSSETGNCSFAHCHDPASRTILLEAVFILECILPLGSGVNRYLPPTPIRILLDHKGRNLSDDEEFAALELEPGEAHRLMDKAPVRDKLLPQMLELSLNAAEKCAAPLRLVALSRVKDYFEPEISRLKQLKQVNPNIRDEEILFLEQSYALLQVEIPKANIRQDALRVIWKGPDSYLD